MRFATPSWHLWPFAASRLARDGEVPFIRWAHERRNVQNELEHQAAAHVGQLIFAFSRLDFLLALAIRNLTSTQSPEKLVPLIERLGFKDRLDCLRELVNGADALTTQAVQTFHAWHSSADKLRTTRNAFVHGRWGMQSQDTLFNASSKMSKSLSGEAKIFSIEELKAEASFATQVLKEFDEWHRKNVIVQ